MNKKILAAAALTLVSGAAMADATLYGILDISVVSVNGSGNGTQSTNAMADGVWLPSVWGLKGSEDLGSGMKAFFQMESNIQANNGVATNEGGKLFDRFAMVGLSGSFGSISAGEQLDPLFLQSFLNGVRLAHSGSLAINGQLGYGGIPGGTNSSTVAGIMSSNWINYKTPVFSNVTISAGYQFGNTSGSNSSSSGEYIMINYDANGLALNGGYEVQNNFNDSNKLKRALVGANYTMGDFKFGGQVNTFKSDNAIDTPVAGHNVDANGYELGVSYNFMPSLTGFANYYWINDNATNTRPSVASLALKYAFSKRTSVWAMANRGTDGASTLYVGTNGEIANTTGLTGHVGDQTGVALGMTHTF
jgi:predicted porin